VRSLPSDYVTNVVRFCPRERCRDGVRLTIEETIEFEALDALPPFDDSGNIAREYSRANQPVAVKNVGSNFA
jgi:hypothetical protein